VVGGDNITTSGTGNTITAAVSGTTDHAVQIGNASGSLTSIGVGTDGQVIIGANSAEDETSKLNSSGDSIFCLPLANSFNLERQSFEHSTTDDDEGLALHDALPI